MSATRTDAALDPFTLAVAAQLRAERAAQRETVRGAAEKAGMSPNTLQRLERGDTPAKVDQLVSLAQVYGLTASEILRRAERRQQSTSEGLTVTRSQELG